MSEDNILNFSLKIINSHILEPVSNVEKNLTMEGKKHLYIHVHAINFQ